MDEPIGLVCRKCHGTYFETVNTKPGRKGVIKRLKRCRNCGKCMTTEERPKELKPKVRTAYR